MTKIKIKNNIAQQRMINAGKRLASIFEQINFDFLINKSTLEIDLFISKKMEEKQIISLAKGYINSSGDIYPSFTCISINNILVHGIPNKNVFVKEEDLVTIDVCGKYNGYCADMARTYSSFKNEIHKKLIDCAHESLNNGIEKAICGNTLGDVGYIIEKTIINYGFSVADTFCGHGIGENLHESPEVYNTGSVGKGVLLKKGMCLAIEPMICEKKSEIIIDNNDGWTAYTKDGGLAVHEEDTIIVSDDYPIVTTRL